MRWLSIGLLGIVASLALTFAGGSHPASVGATNPVGMKPLLACPDVSGIAPVDLFNDIMAIADRYGSSTGDANYHPLYDVKDANGAIDLFNDIFYAADNFGVTCPLVDLQVAAATKWGIDNLPKTNDAAGETALEALGYYRGSTDVPGQGIHYVNLQNWDGAFDPQAPEGIVYNNGKLAAQLYVVDGNIVGWGTHEAFTYPPPAVPHDVDLEGAADGPQCNPACSWAAGEGWHLHYFLCTVDIGTPSAAAIPAAFVPSVQTQAGCASFGGNDPECTIPITVTPCYRWARTVGWMGHLWNHELNPNQIPDSPGSNGRFSDCVPDGSGWKAFNCPA